MLTSALRLRLAIRGCSSESTVLQLRTCLVVLVMSRSPSSCSCGTMLQPKGSCNVIEYNLRSAARFTSSAHDAQALNIAIGQCLIAGAVGVWFFTSNADKGKRRVARQQRLFVKPPPDQSKGLFQSLAANRF